MRSTTVTCALVAFAVLAPGVLGVVTDSRDVYRGVASPTSALPDASHWRVDVPAGHSVRVRADAATATPFTLTWCRSGTACSQSLPTLARDITLQAGLVDAWWVVSVDPEVGAKVSIHVVFDGFLVDQGNMPGSFTLTDLASDQPCLGGACLP